MLPSGRKKHRNPERPERQASFLLSASENRIRMLNISTGISQENARKNYWFV